MPFRLVGVQRQAETPVHKALREALVNAIVHADYAERSPLLAIKAPDYFEFRNPGRMRVPVEEALRGGRTDCRNRSIQRMFSLIGVGEQAGSGVPRVLEHWKSQHYRAPELKESVEPEETTIRLRTVSLLPEETLTELRMRFGEAFEGLDEHSRVALATAEIEGFVTNGRLRRIIGAHPRDITVLLGKLVGADMLVKDGQGRATSYHIAGVPVVDLAAPGSVDRSSGGAAPSTENLITSSTQKASSSEHFASKSEHSEPKSVPLRPKSVPSRPDKPALADQSGLRALAEPVSGNRYADPGTVRQTILNICQGRFLTLNQIAELLGRSSVRLRQKFIKPMVDDEKLLERRFPQQPNHVWQAYRIRETGDD